MNRQRLLTGCSSIRSFALSSQISATQYITALLRWLKPGAAYLAVNYMIPDQDGPPFGTTRDEIWQRFSPHFELIQEWVPRSYPNRTGLERMFWWKRKSV